MFHRIQSYPVIDLNGSWRPRAYADSQPDGRWDGWIVFFPLSGSVAIAPPEPDTTQSTMEALAAWAAGVTSVYLEDALARALRTADTPVVLDRLAAAEYEALEDAERLQSAAMMDRATAEVDQEAAEAARADAEAIRRKRAELEGDVAATDEAAAQFEAEVHESAARDARTVAADAAARRRSAEVAAKPKSEQRGRRSTSKKR
jgi:hypothetical protein